MVDKVRIIIMAVLSIAICALFTIEAFAAVNINLAFGGTVRYTAKDIGADAIVTYTNTSQTANVLSGYRPDCPIFAITDNQKAFHKLSLAQGVTPILVLGQDSIDNTMSKGIEALEKEGIFEKGDKLVVAGGNRILPLAKENQAISGIMII